MNAAADLTPWLGPDEPVTLNNCDREPIHLPGRVQAHGALLIVADEPGVVLQASRNAASVLGLDVPVDEILGENLSQVLGEFTAAQVVKLPRLGPPSVRPSTIASLSGRVLVAQCFEPAPGLVGIDLEPVQAEDEVDAASITVGAAQFASLLGAARSVEEVAQIGSALMQNLTGFDRVWTYRFEEDGHGVIVAEQRPDHLPPFLGLHFPEGDIPAQARALYLTAGARLIGDSDVDDVELIPQLNPLTGERVDLSGSDLRGVSPMHVRYLRNMGVRTSMSVPLVVEGRLWGLLSAHQYGRAQRVTMLVRSQCETLGKLTSLQLAAAQRLTDATDAAAVQRDLRKVIAQLASAGSVTQGLLGAPQALLGSCGAAGAVVEFGDARQAAGVVPSREELDALVTALQSQDRDLLVTDSAAEQLGVSGGIHAAGVLAICLSRLHRRWVLWLRPEQVTQVTWANRDRELVRRDPAGALELGERESFERWAQQVSGRSTPWSSAHVTAARELKAAIDARAARDAEELQLRATALARANDELDAFAYSAAHDLRQPTRAIALRTQFLLEDAHERLEREERESLEAILRLTDRMSALTTSLLEYAKLDYDVPEPQTLRLTDVMADVMELIGPATEDAEVAVDDVVVHADRDGLQQVLFNLVWNAIKYGDGQPQVHVGAAPRSRTPCGRSPATSRQNPGDDPDVIYVRDNGIGIDAAHHEEIFSLFRRLHRDDEYGGGSGAGLALCRRITARAGGTIWVESNADRGSTFKFTMAPD